MTSLTFIDTQVGIFAIPYQRYDIFPENPLGFYSFAGWNGYQTESISKGSDPRSDSKEGYEENEPTSKDTIQSSGAILICLTDLCAQKRLLLVSSGKISNLTNYTRESRPVTQIELLSLEIRTPSIRATKHGPRGVWSSNSARGVVRDYWRRRQSQPPTSLYFVTSEDNHTRYRTNMSNMLM